MFKKDELWMEKLQDLLNGKRSHFASTKLQLKSAKATNKEAILHLTIKIQKLYFRNNVPCASTSFVSTDPWRKKSITSCLIISQLQIKVV